MPNTIQMVLILPQNQQGMEQAATRGNRQHLHDKGLLKKYQFALFDGFFSRATQTPNSDKIVNLMTAVTKQKEKKSIWNTVDYQRSEKRSKHT